eukprot:766233-Hanusia_phi.AAC.6
MIIRQLNPSPFVTKTADATTNIHYKVHRLCLPAMNRRMTYLASTRPAFSWCRSGQLHFSYGNLKFHSPLA